MLESLRHFTRFLVTVAFGLAAVATATCGVHNSPTSSPEILNVKANATVPADTTKLTITTSGNYPVVERNVGCGSENFTVESLDEATFKLRGDEREYNLRVVSLVYDDQEIVVEMSDEFRESAVADKTYEVTLRLPTGNLVHFRKTLWSGSNCDSDDTDSNEDCNNDTEKSTETDSIDGTTETPTCCTDETDTSRDSDTPEDTGTVVETDTPVNTDTSVDTNVTIDTDTTAASDTPTDTFADTDTPVDTSTMLTGVVSPQRVEAECAFGAYEGDCKGVTTGDYSTDVIDPLERISVPICDDDGKIVLYMDPDAWFSLENVDFTPYNMLAIRIANKKTNATINFYVDSIALTNKIGSINGHYTGSWDIFEIQTIDIGAVTGVHDLFVVGGINNYDQGNGNIDWVELYSEGSIDVCASVTDCYNGQCWACANVGPCHEEYLTCQNNDACVEANACVESDCIDLDDPGACVTDCLNTHPGASTDYLNYRTCVMCDVCTAGCGAESNCIEADTSWSW